MWPTAEPRSDTEPRPVTEQTIKVINTNGCGERVYMFNGTWLDHSDTDHARYVYHTLFKYWCLYYFCSTYRTKICNANMPLCVGPNVLIRDGDRWEYLWIDSNDIWHWSLTYMRKGCVRHEHKRLSNMKEECAFVITGGSKYAEI